MLPLRREAGRTLPPAPLRVKRFTLLGDARPLDRNRNEMGFAGEGGRVLW